MSQIPLYSLETPSQHPVIALVDGTGVIVDPATTDELALKADIEKLTATNLISSGSITAAASFPVWIAPFACTVEQVALVAWDLAIAASDTNYWTVTLRRTRAGVSTDIATKTTQATGGEAVASRVSWNFNTITFSVTNKVLQAGDVVALAFTPTGAPANFVKVAATLRYVPT